MAMKIVIMENPRPLSIEHYNDVANAPLSASLNSGYALAVSRQAGWDTAYLDFTTSPDCAQSLADRILAENADIVLVHWVYSWGHEAAVRDVLTLLKREGSGLLGAFGLFPTMSVQQTVRLCPAAGLHHRGRVRRHAVRAAAGIRSNTHAGGDPRAGTQGEPFYTAHGACRYLQASSPRRRGSQLRLHDHEHRSQPRLLR